MIAMPISQRKQAISANVKSKTCVDFFEPPDCHKGDVARVGFYMAERYGVVIPPPEWLMFEEWSLKDSVSPWEAERERRIAEISGVPNRFVRGIIPEDSGGCS